MCAEVIIVGAGLAGMAAALAAETAGADVILSDRGPIGMGTNSALSNAAFSGPVSAERAEEYVVKRDVALFVDSRVSPPGHAYREARRVRSRVSG